MSLYIYSPDWFHGIDTTIELLSLVIAFIVYLYSYKLYRISKEKRYIYFSASFFLVAIAYLFKIAFEMVVYSKYIEQRVIGPFIISKVVIAPVTWIHTYSHALFRLLLMFAFLILLAVTLKVTRKQTLILMSYLLVVVTLASSQAQLLFHITNVIMIGMLVHHFYNNYTQRKTRSALFVTLAFLWILISHATLIFKTYDPNIYVTGLAFQLVGFATLLYAFMLVKKK